MDGTRGMHGETSRTGAAPFDGVRLERCAEGSTLEEKSEQEPATIPEADMTLGDAISSGVPEDVVKVLGRMTDEETARELTAVEGVKHHAATPILRSARSGNVALFKAVHQSMKTKLNDAQMAEALAARDDNEIHIFMEEAEGLHQMLDLADGEKYAETLHYKMLLAMVAAEGGSEDVFDEVEKLLGGEEAIKRLLQIEKGAIQLLTGAAKGGNISIFRRVLELKDCDIVEARTFTGYSVLMAAARSGSVDVVSSVGELLAKYLDKIKGIRKAEPAYSQMVDKAQAQVADMVRANNKKGYSCLLTAASSGNPEVVTKVFDIMKKHLADDYVQRMTIAPCWQGDTALMVAASVPDPDGAFFSKVVEILDTHLSKQQMCDMINATGLNKWNVLMEAAQFGYAGVISAVMDVLREKLKAHEVTRMLLSRTGHGYALLDISVRSCKPEAVRAVVKALQAHLQPDQMRNMLTATRRHNWNVLMEAASRGHRDVTEAVMDVLCKKLEENEVSRMLFSQNDDGVTCLMHSTESGRAEAVEGIVEAMEIQAKRFKSRGQVGRTLKLRRRDGANILTLAAQSGESSLFNSVEKIICERLSKGEMVKMIQARWSNCTLLTKAAERGEVSAVEAAGKLLSYLTKDQVLKMVQSGLDSTDQSPTIFMAAVVANKSMEVVEAVVEMARKYLTDEQVIELMKAQLGEFTVFRMVTEPDRDPEHMKALVKMMDMLTNDQVVELTNFGDGRGRTLLVLAVGGGRPEILQLVAQFVRGKLNNNQVLHLLRKENEEHGTALMLAKKRRSVNPTIYQIMAALTEAYEGPTVLSQGPVVRASEPGIEASCARFSSVSSDPVGETHQPKKQSFTPQLSNEDFSDNNGGKRNGDPRSALPEGGVTYPSSRQAGAGPDSNGNGKQSEVSSVAEAISTGRSSAIEEVLKNMSEREAIRELSGPANARVTPILLAARESGEMFSVLLKLMEDNMTETQWTAALAGGTEAIAFPKVERKRFSDTAVTSGNELSDEVMRALVLVAAQGKCMEVLEVALLQGISTLTLADLFEAQGDAESLFLAAARGGRIDVFDHICEALPKKAADLRKDLGGNVGKRLLYEALQGGSVEMIQKVRRELGEELEAMIAEKSSASTILIRAARSGCLNAFKEAMSMLKTKPINELLLYTVNLRTEKRIATVLTAVASSGQANAIKGLMKAVESVLTQGQVASMLQAKTSTGGSILSEAVASGSTTATKTVIEEMGKYLKRDQMSSMVRDVDADGNNVFAQAILSGSTEGLQGFAAVMDETLQEEEVSEVLLSLGKGPSARVPGGGKSSTLGLAAETGIRKMFEAVLDILYENLPGTEVLKMLEATNEDGDSILQLGVKTGVRGVFEAVVDAIDCVPGEQLRKQIIPRGDAALADAILYSNAEGHQAIMEVLVEKLDVSLVEVWVMILSPVNSGLTDAILSADAEALKAIVDIMVDKLRLKEAEVHRMIMRGRDSLLADAILSGSAEVVEATMDIVEKRFQSSEGETRNIHDVLQHRIAGRNILMTAVISQDQKVFETVTRILKKLHPQDLLRMVSASDREGRNLVAWASRQTSAVFSRAVKYIEETAPAQILSMIRELDNLGRTIVMAAASSGEKDTIKHVTSFVETRLRDDDEVLELIVPKTEKPSCSILNEAAKSGNRAAVEAVRHLLLEKLRGDKVAKEFANAFKLCADEASKELLECKTGTHGPSVAADRLEDVAIFLEYGAVPGKHAFRKLVKSFEDDPARLKDCFRDAVSSAGNPFIPGMTLSVSLADAALMLVEGDRRVILSLQRAVDDLLLEILERLPQTVGGLQGEDNDCTAMLEPETLANFPDDMVGPLSLALRRREHMEKFCITPLVLDFMTRKFTLGLPKLQSKIYRPSGQEGPGSEEDSKKLLKDNDLLPESPPLGMFRRMVHGCGNDEAGHLPSLLPGAQFVIAGQVSNPFNYYDVPVLRMILGLVVYLAMLVLFSTTVLVQDYGHLNKGEYALAVYVVASMMTEVSEVWRDFKMYLRDPWNVLDVVALLLLAGGLVTRAVKNDEVWGQYLYALSAPALFSRILFFGQILPAQGPMIQVLLSMTRELVTFGVIMLVVMFGFAMSFFTLFQDLESETYGTAWLAIFKAIFGDVELFDEITGQPVDGVATVVLVLYMTVMTIMLLNLLIAVLSTAHANVQQSVQKEFEISKARMIGHYRRVVKEDMLPAPFNLVQCVVALPYKMFATEVTFKAVRRSMGIAVFSLVLGPVAVVAALLLGTLSVPKVVHRTWRRNSNQSPAWRVGVVFALAVCSCLVSPFCLAILWIKAALHATARMLYSLCKAPPLPTPTPPISFHTVDENLKRSPGRLSVAELRVYLEKPMNDPEVRRDEETRRATVEHIKLLRDRLEETGDQRMEPLWGELDRLGAGVSDLDGKIGEMHRKLSKKMDERVEEMRDMFGKFSDKLEKLTQHVESKPT